MAVHVKVKSYQWYGNCENWQISFGKCFVIHQIYKTFLLPQYFTVRFAKIIAMLIHQLVETYVLVIVN